MTGRKKGTTSVRKFKTMSKGSKQAHAKHRSRHARIEPLQTTLTSQTQLSNIEEMLASSVSSQLPSEKNSNLPLLPEILYNMTPSTKNLGYNSGFAVGVKIYQTSDQLSDAAPLINALESAGFNHTLYSPMSDTVIISARRDHGIKLSDKAHVFESGLIAGYLSAATGREVSVMENQCVYGESEFCQFVATESNKSRYEAVASNDLENVTEMIAKGVRATGAGSRVSDNFYMLEMLPFMKEPIGREASKLLYIAGQRMGEQGQKSMDESIKNLTSMLGIRNITLFKKKKNELSSVRLKYKPINSVSEYIDLSTSLVAGMIKGMYNNAPSVVRKITQDGSYTVDLIL